MLLGPPHSLKRKHADRRTEHQQSCQRDHDDARHRTGLAFHQRGIECGQNNSEEKNRREQVRARLRDYHGAQLADLRIFVADESGESVPTKAGICVRVEQLHELRRAVDALIEAEEARAA